MKKRICTILIVISVSLSFIKPSVYCQDSSQKMNKEAIDLTNIEKLKNIRVKNEGRIAKIPGAVGIGIGLSEDGKELVFIVYVERITNENKAMIPNNIEGTPVRIIESGIFRAY